MFTTLLKSTSGHLKPLWNVSGHVGLNATNYEDDSGLVAFGFWCMGRPASQAPDTQNKAIYYAVPVGPKCTGRADDPLVVAIRTYQQTRGGTQDGFVSAMNQTGGYADATGAMRATMILTLNNHMFDALQQAEINWPRIDLMSNCPPAVKAYVQVACSLAKAPGS